jgi:hypothetical protein
MRSEVLRGCQFSDLKAKTCQHRTTGKAVSTFTGRLPLTRSLIRPLEVLNGMQRIAFCRSPPLWAMGVAHALQAIAHGVGSYKDQWIHMIDKNMGHSNFIRPNQQVTDHPIKPLTSRFR